MSDIQEQIKITHRKTLEQDFNEIIKELKQEEHKNLELSMRINKAIEYINKNAFDVVNSEHKSIINVEELLNILKGENK